MSTRTRSKPSNRSGETRADAGRPVGTGSQLRVFAAAILIVVAGALAYSNSFDGVFVLDEQSAIVDNPNIRSLATSFSAPPEVGLGGRPIASLSFALNYALAPAEGRDVFAPPPPSAPEGARSLFYANLWGYHAVNLAVHLLCALTLFGIARRTFLQPALPAWVRENALPLACTIAFVWVLHPLNTNAVTYVAQRVESLMSLFFLLTLYASIRAGESSGGGARAVAWSAAACAACLLGAGTKEVIVVAPLLVVLYDRLFGIERIHRWAFYAGLFVSWLVVAALVAAFPRAASVGTGLPQWTPFTYLATQAGIIVHYLRLAVVPWPLVFDYEWKPAHAWLQVLAPGLVLAALLAASAWGLWRRRPLAYLGAWFFLILAPSSSVLPIVTEVAAEHRMYLPVAAVITLAVVGTCLLLRRATPKAMPATMVIFGVGAMAFGVLTFERNADYESYERLWTDTVAKRPDNARARSNYATVLMENGRFAEAEAQLKEAVAVRPDYPEGQLNYGASLCSQGKFEEGIAHIRRAIELAPGYLDAYRNLAEATRHSGQHAASVAAYRKVLELAPNDPVAMIGAAWLLSTSPMADARDGRAAVSLAERAVEVTGRRDPRALDVLAAAFAEAGRFDQAVTVGQEAASLARSIGAPAEVLEQLDARLEAYRAGQPIRGQ